VDAVATRRFHAAGDDFWCERTTAYADLGEADEDRVNRQEAVV
jgi:hypothetical protein